jgi:stage II sporulation protein M
MLESLREAFGEIWKWHPILLVAFIFLNNSVKCFLIILFGVIFGVAPALFIILNGFIIGLAIFELKQLYGLPFALAATLPHGVIEIPMFLLSAAIGIRIGYELMNKIRGRGSVKRELKNGVKFFALRILPLLFLAAVIEVFITPLVLYFLSQRLA